jgi:hypothetical protein
MKQTPAPHGYQWVSVPIDSNVVLLLMCKKCGGFVYLHRTHDAWHKKNG